MDSEILDRVRRIETRVTRIGLAVGAEVGGNKPTWNHKRGSVDLPSSAGSVAECVDIIPGHIDYPVPIYVKDDLIGHIQAPRP